MELQDTPVAKFSESDLLSYFTKASVILTKRLVSEKQSKWKRKVIQKLQDTSTFLFEVALPTLLLQAYRSMPLWNYIKEVWKLPKGGELNRIRRKPQVTKLHAVSKLTGIIFLFINALLISIGSRLELKIFIL